MSPAPMATLPTSRKVLGGCEVSQLPTAATSPATGPGALQTRADRDPYNCPKMHLQHGNCCPRRDQTGKVSQLGSTQPDTGFSAISAVPGGVRWTSWWTTG